MSSNNDTLSTELVAMIVEQSTRDAAFATNAVIDAIKRERNTMAKAFATLYDTLDKLPDFAMSVAISKALDAAFYHRDTATRYLTKEHSY